MTPARLALLHGGLGGAGLAALVAAFVAGLPAGAALPPVSLGALLGVGAVGVAALCVYAVNAAAPLLRGVPSPATLRAALAAGWYTPALFALTALAPLLAVTLGAESFLGDRASTAGWVFRVAVFGVAIGLVHMHLWRLLLLRVADRFDAAILPVSNEQARAGVLECLTVLIAAALLGVVTRSAVAVAVLLLATVWWLGRCRRTRQEWRDALHEYAKGAPQAESVERRVSPRARVAALVSPVRARAESDDQARLSLEDRRRDRTRFLAAMSHDLRGPLNSILGFAEYLLEIDKAPLGAAQRENLRAIRRSGDELLNQLNDVLDSARLDSGRLPLQLAWTPPVEVLTDAVRRGRELVLARPIEIDAEFQPGLPPVYVDRERIVQAVTGLFRQTARAMERGRIVLRARRASDGAPDREIGRASDGALSRTAVRVEVAADGAGIRPEDRAKIFEAFRTVTSAHGRRISGLGLTLHLARALVRAQGGDIWLEVTPSGDTLLSVTLPTVRDASDAAAG